MIAQTTRYGISTSVPLGNEDAVARTKGALAAEGFGILSAIDVAATMKQKLDVDFRPDLILGACNPPLALRALTAAMDPVEALQLTGNAEIGPIAEEVKARLTRVLEAIGGA